MFEIPLWCSSVTGPTHNNQKLEVQIMKIRELMSNDRAQWQTLYRGYAAFYKVDTNEAKLDRLFSWLLDPSHPCEGLVAEAEDGQKAESGLVGLAHFRAMPSPLHGAEIGFLDDLFVDPSYRGGGAGDQLLRHLDNIAAARGWPVMRWITQDNNYRARGLYDQLALRTGWITYEMNAETTGRPDR